MLDSLLQQDMSYSEYEIVCVDDCSADNSVEIITQYQLRYPNIRLHKNSKNCRLATNVNTLFSLAEGEYIWGIGQDDYIEPNCLGRLYSLLKKNNLDVIIFNYRRVNEDETTNAECRVVPNSTPQTGVEWIKDKFGANEYRRYILGYTWRSICRNELIKKYEIQCVKDMNYEDTVLLLKMIVYAKRVMSVEDMLYNYRINTRSITYNVNFRKRGDLIYEFAFIVGQEVETFYDQLITIDEELAEGLYVHLIQRYNNFTLDLIRTTNQYKRDFYRLVRSNKEFVHSKWQYLNWKSKILLNRYIGYLIACLGYIGYRCYKTLIPRRKAN